MWQGLTERQCSCRNMNNSSKTVSKNCVGSPKIFYKTLLLLCYNFSLPCVENVSAAALTAAAAAAEAAAERVLRRRTILKWKIKNNIPMQKIDLFARLRTLTALSCGYDHQASHRNHRSERVEGHRTAQPPPRPVLRPHACWPRRAAAGAE